MTPSAADDHSELDVRVGWAWRDYHRILLDVAFRVLGSLSEAEDVVQEAYARLVRADSEAIDDVRGWLVVVVSRLCFDQLRSARWQRQHPADLDATTQLVIDADPADRVTLDDEVRLALHVVMARLTPAERTAFVLHDVFGYSFEDVAAVVGRSRAACRQLAARARRHLQDDAASARFEVASTEHRRVTDEFIDACATGDLERLLGVLDPEVAGQADIGGTVGLLPPVAGREHVGPRLLLFFGPDSGTTLLTLPTGSQPTLLALRDGRVYATVAIAVRDGRIVNIHSVVDPAKLEELNVILDS